MTKEIPDIVIGRLPRYLQILRHLRSDGIMTISSFELGTSLGISAAQIRKDLSHFGEFGKQGSGYPVDYLIKKLQDILKIGQVWDVILIGAGNLGHALAQHQGLGNRGFRIVAIFDNDTDKIGTVVAGQIVQNSSFLPQYIQQTGIKIAILTVPASAAQETAEMLVKSGIHAILNYAPIHLKVPEWVQIEHIDPVLQLQHMTYYL
jgi:redox-sensing transcriptional repressor